MPKDILHWGRPPQLVFESENEYFRALGHLVNSKAYSISYEYNKKNGSYSDACRIHILSNAQNIPQAFENKRTTNGRINCNEYVENLIDRHNFVRENQRIYCMFEEVAKTVPNEYFSDFAKGYNESSQKDRTLLFTSKSLSVKYDELELLKVDVPKINSVLPTKTSNNNQTKKDYLKEHIKNIDIGNRGEKIVFDIEKQKLEKAVAEGKIVSVDKYLVWESLNNDSAGYDICSLDIDTMQPIYIEVKTTTGNKFTPFYMSDGEIKYSSENSSQYRLYRLFELKGHSAKYFELIGDVSKNTKVFINAVNYMVTLR